MFIKKIIFEREKVIDIEQYPFNIEIVKKIHELTITSPVTFLIGENGIGKSTFIEAIAVSLGLNAEGGTQNFNFSTKNTTSELSNYFIIHKYNYPKTKFFLRAETFYAETFYNVASEIDNLEIDNYYGGSLHECSHGESFLKLIQNRFTSNGLYILDEPESALSPQSQMSLLYLIDELVKQGSQFIIATHSPILISYYKGKILDLSNNFNEIKYEDTDIYKIYKLYLDDAEGMQKRLFQDNEE